MESANNGHTRDFKASKGAVITDFTGKNLEHTFFLRNSREINVFFGNMDNYAKELLEIKAKMKFDKIRCNFKSGKLNMELQKELVKFQASACNEIVVKMTADDFETFKIVLEYAKNKFDKPVFAFVDIKLRDPMLVELMKFFQEVTPAGVIWKYRKIDNNIRKYRFISKTLKSMGIPYFASECQKRCRIGEFWEMSISAVLKAYFGFSGCCMDYKFPTKQGFPAKEVDKFLIESYSWAKQENKDYYNNRLRDFENLNKIKTSKSEINQRAKLKRLFDHLDKL